MLSAPTTDITRQTLEADPYGRQMAYQGAIEALRAKGVPGLIANRMGSVMPYSQVENQWAAFANPSAPATTGQNYLDYLNQLFGLTKFG